MAVQFKTWDDVLQWEKQSGAELSPENREALKQAFGVVSNNPNESKQLAPTQNPKQHWAVTLVAILLMLFGGTKIMVKGLKLMT
jgi:hypothetical protein